VSAVRDCRLLVAAPALNLDVALIAHAPRDARATGQYLSTSIRTWTPLFALAARALLQSVWPLGETAELRARFRRSPPC